MTTPFGTDGGVHDTTMEDGLFPITLISVGESSGTAVLYRIKLILISVMSYPDESLE